MRGKPSSPRSELNPEKLLFHQPLALAAEAIRSGKIVAVKGLGGFHLMVAAHDEVAVRRLRERKHREEKPFALMFPSIEAIKRVCEVSPFEERLLHSPEAPIVILRRLRPSSQEMPSAGLAVCAPSLAPNNPNLGVMLPYTPLHHLLLSLLGFPVVATSGNLSDEPICTDERDALARLGGIANLFLVHNRPIVRHVDDSIVRMMAGRELVLRRARGYAPLPVQLPGRWGHSQGSRAGHETSATETSNSSFPLTPALSPRERENPRQLPLQSEGHQTIENRPPSLPLPKGEGRGEGEGDNLQAASPASSDSEGAGNVPRGEGRGRSVLAVGAHLKNTIALSVGPQVFVSQHIGNLETDQSYEAFRRVIADFKRLYETGSFGRRRRCSPRLPLDEIRARPRSLVPHRPSTLNPQPSTNLSPAPRRPCSLVHGGE